MSWRAALASGVLILLGSATPAGAATPAPTPSPTPAPTPLCAHAAELTQGSKPQQALALIDDARSGAAPDDACVIERDAALQAVAGADALMGQASEASGEAKPDWDEIRETIAAAEALDADVTTPEELGDLVKEHPAAEPDNLSQTWVEQVTTSWGDFTEKYLTPLGKFLLAAAAVVALIVALARLLLLLPFDPRSSLGGRVWVNLGTAALLALSGVVWAKYLPDAISATKVDWSTLAWLSLLAGLATACTTYSLATRLRVSITVAGKSDDAGATEIVALLRELGAEKPRGLEVPRGADVDILDGKAIADAPTGILAALLKALQAVVGFVPWVVVVDDREGETFAVVTRNGRSWDSAVIKKQPFGKDGPTVDTRKMAAAFILVALSRGYAPSDFQGLAGTTDWRALGWQYVATTDKSLDRPARLWLLNEAVEADPGSALAQLALQHELYRTAETEAALREYLTWLTAYPLQTDLPVSMQLRIAYNRLVAAVNRCATAAFAQDGVITAPADNDQPTKDAAAHLAGLLAEDSEEPLRDHMKAVAIPLLHYGRAEMVDDEPGLPSPTRVYNEICRDAVVRGPSPELVERLRKNLQTPEVVDWARVDPMLKRVAALPEFEEAFAKPPPKMAAAQPFSAHAEALKTASLDSPAALLGPTMSSTRLAKLLDVHTVIAARLQSAARLALSIEGDLATFRFLIVEALFEAGIFSKRDIVESALDRHELADTVITAATKKKYSAPDREALLDWFWRLKTFV